MELEEPRGFFSSPRYPLDYRGKLECSWVLRVSPSSMAKFTVEYLLLPGSHMCQDSALIIYEENHSERRMSGKPWKWKWKWSHVRLFVTPWTVASQAPPSLGFSRQECWSGLPFPSPGDLSNPGIEPASPTLQADALPSEPPGRPLKIMSKLILMSKRHIFGWQILLPYITLTRSLKINQTMPFVHYSYILTN